MGLGKSLQTIALLHTYHAQFAGERSMLVVPANVLLNWHDEFKQWLPPRGSPAEHTSELTLSRVRIVHLSTIVIPLPYYETCLITAKSVPPFWASLYLS